MPTRSNRPNPRKPPKTSFLALWIIQKCISTTFEWSRISDTMAKSFRPFSRIKICNIKSIQQPNLQKMAKNLLFGTLDHSKIHFPDFSMILHDLAVLPIVGKHLVLSKYAISSRSNRPKSWKRPKSPFLALWIIQKCILRVFEWPIMTW